MKLSSIAAIFGFVGVALGAFGAHGLEAQLSPEARDWWQTATFYLLVHAALAAAVTYRGGRGAMPAAAFLLGALLFSGSLYLMALGAPRWLGAVTPLGGLGFLAGWALLAWSARREA